MTGNSATNRVNEVPIETTALRKTLLWVCLLLALSTAVAYRSIVYLDFVNFDDPDYITENQWVKQGITWEGIKWAFNVGHASNWHPMTWVSHMLDVEMYGLKPMGHHGTNLLFHIANSILLLLLLHQMTGAVWRSAFVAALFALHPLHVESVAWLSERKDVLSTFFGLLCLMTYCAYARSAEPRNTLIPQPVRSPIKAERVKWTWYVLAFVLFALGLMSKPMLVTWPFVMLLLDYWPLERTASDGWQVAGKKWRKLVVEKIPFFVLSVGSSVMTFVAQHEGGAVAKLSALAFLPRIQNALVSYAAYLQQMLLPINLAAYYPFPESVSLLRVLLASCMLAAVSWLALQWRRKRPCFLVGWLWYLGMLVPVIGIVQVGFQARADRYTYLSLTGIFIAIVWGMEEATHNWRNRRKVLPATAIGVLVVCAVLTSAQTIYWKDSETLHRHTLAVTNRNATVHLNLGSALIAQSRMQEAAEQFIAALQIRPEYSEARSNLGFALAAQGRYEEAITHYQLALQAKPNGKTYFLLGNALNMQGKTTEAIAEYRRALEIDPNQLGALNDLTWILATHPNSKFRNGPEAVQLGERACQIVGREPMFLGTLAAAYAEAGRFDDAIRAGEQARELAEHSGLKELATRNVQLVEQYRAGKPFRDLPMQPPQ